MKTARAPVSGTPELSPELRPRVPNTGKLKHTRLWHFISQMGNSVRVCPLPTVFIHQD